MHPGTSRRAAPGFTLPELLVVMAILGILAAIAIPVLAALQSAGQDSNTRNGLLAIKSSITSTLPVWRGSPPTGLLRICFDTGTFPPEGGQAAPVNTCTPGTWTADDSTGQATSPPLTGTLPGRISAQGVVVADGSFCIDATNPDGTNPYYITDSTAEPQSGTCTTETWTAPTGYLADPSAAQAAVTGVAPAPTGVAVTVAQDRTVTVSWPVTANPGDGYLTYQVGITGSDFATGEGLKTITPTADGTVACLMPGGTICDDTTSTLSPGLYSATVRARTDDTTYTWGPGAVVNFVVP